MRALELVRHWVCEIGLTLHPHKTRLVDSRTESFTFLEYEFRGLNHWPRDKSLQGLQASLRPLVRRTSGDSLPFIVTELNPKLRGWFAYFQHSTYRNVFQDIDGWLRMRLRSLLRKRSGRRGRGADHHRWPKRLFSHFGLFSLTTARAQLSQPSRR